jgi:peptidoglycan/LPS O-acetylase OafA/YrhL
MIHRRTIPALDGVRGIAILLVLVCHLAYSTGAVLNGTLKGYMLFGWTGVDLFFVLSGFLITGILIDTRDTPGRARTFYRRRCLRILPLYYLAVAAGFFIVPRVNVGWLSDLYPSSQGWVSYLLYVQNWWIPLHERSHSLFGQFWSLGVEEQFYLFWPMCVWWISPRYLARVCVAGMVSTLLLRLALMPHHAGATIILMSTVTRMDSLLCGALCAIVVRNKELYATIGRWIPRLAVISVAGIVYIYKGPPAADQSYVQTIGFTMLAIGYATLVLTAFRSDGSGSLVERVLCVSPLRMFGKYSYGIYVYHGLIFVAAARAIKVHTTLQSVIFCAGVATTSLLAAVISYELFEKWFLRLKDRDVTRKRKELSASAGYPTAETVGQKANGLLAEL